MSSGSRRRRRGSRGRRSGKGGERQDKQEKVESGGVRRMLMNVVYPEEIRVAITGAGGLEELYIERAGSGQAHGNIYKGKVLNIEPNLQAAFIDIGGERNGFLHASDVILPDGGYKDILKKRKRKALSGDGKPSIDQMLYKGQELLVQITRESFSTKGPSLTTFLSLPGRYLVLMPELRKRGVSKKITDENERAELKKALDELDPPGEHGFIIRTAGMGRGKAELQSDLSYLGRLWETIVARAKKAKAPEVLYRETDLVIRSIRDYFYDDIAELVIDGEAESERAAEFLKSVMPGYETRVVKYAETDPVFNRYGVEKEIDRIFSRHVRLPSGGGIVVEQTEAMVTIDVNTGSFVKGGSARDMIVQTNLEAAREVARQLRLRDLGGLIMVDFVDMDKNGDRRLVEDELRKAMQPDRARRKILHISDLGVLEMTRQRVRKSLKGALYSTCPACGGTGVCKSRDVLSLELLRRLKAMMGEKQGDVVVAHLHPETALGISNLKRTALAALEQEGGCRVELAADSGLGMGEMRFSRRDAPAGEGQG